MAMANCRWFQVAQGKVPSYFITGDGKLNSSVLMNLADAYSSGAIGLGDFAMAAKALETEFVQAGEDAADASALIEQGVTWVGNYNGVSYIFFDTQSGVFVYARKCGMMAQLPYVIGGAVLLGLGGFAWAKTRKGAKGKKLTIIAPAVGAIGGAAAGYALALVLTTSNIKAWEGMGLVDVQRMGATRFLRRPCPRGMVWNVYMKRCIRPL